MNRCVGILAVMALLAVLPRPASAQEIIFSGAEIVNLAKAIAVEAARANQLPAAYQMTMTNGHTMVVVAPSVYELLCRTIVVWKEKRAFPAQVSLKLLDIVGPAYDPEFEPKRPGMVIAMPTADFGLYAPKWLALIEMPGHKLPSRMTFEPGYKLTAAQIVVAMAVLIDETVKKGEFPTAIAIPLVYSPKNWLATANPLPVSAKPGPDVQEPEPTLINVDLSIAINGIVLSETGPVLPTGGRGPIPPFCGTVRIDMTGFGPITQIRLLCDTEELKIYRGTGPHSYELNTLPLPDGVHTIAATATDDTGKTYAYVFSFTARNGRHAGFTPAEVESK